MKRTVPLVWLLTLLPILLGGCNLGGESPAAPLAPGQPAAGEGMGEYTILLQTFDGPDHSFLANQWKKSLGEKLGWKGLAVVTAADHSELYWGRFPSIEAARPSLWKAKAHRSTTGAAPFERAYVTVSPGSYQGPPEWDLRNCRGAYTLVVADFQDVPQENYIGRRDKAVAYCRELREQGHEAYFHHGPSTSSVTIGSFGPEAVRTEKAWMPQPGGAPAVRADRRVPVDPRLMALRSHEVFRYRSWNGRQAFNVVKDSAGREASRTVVESYVAQVPGRDDAAATVNPIGDRQPRQAP